MPLLAVKMCCYFKNPEYLQKIFETFSVFDLTSASLKESASPADLAMFEVSSINNYDYLEGKKKIELPNYRQILESFQGCTPLHIAIIRNNFECVKLLLEETNLDAIECTASGSTSVILACKHGVDIEILESLLVSLRTVWPIEKVKEFLDLKEGGSEMRAYDYCKHKKRSDLAVVLEEFVDTSKSILDIGFSFVENFDFKATARS